MKPDHKLFNLDKKEIEEHMPDIVKAVSKPNYRAPLKTYCAARLRRWVVLEILMYTAYIPVSALHPPCTQLAHDTF